MNRSPYFTCAYRKPIVDNQPRVIPDVLPGYTNRWHSNRKIPPPPRTPCADPLELPFPKLKARNKNGTMTLDEELLRAIVGQFTIRAVASIPFSKIFEKLKSDNPHLSYLLYDDQDYLWSYIRCYPEQFTVDRDPRLPEHVWYLSKCKLVAKADRRRYERELSSIKDFISSMNENAEWDAITFDENLERQALIYISAIFAQIHAKFPDLECDNVQLEAKFIEAVLKESNVSPCLLKYFGDDMGAFLYRRLYCFIVFGPQVSQRSAAFVDTIRSLSKRLVSLGGSCDPKSLYDYLLTSPYLCKSGLRAIALTPSNFKYDDFVMFLFSQKMIFRLLPRQNLVQLRHGPVPEINQQAINEMPKFKIIDELTSFDDIETFAEPSVGGFHEGFGGGDDDVYKKGVLPPSLYTMRWLNENFNSSCAVKAVMPDDSDLQDELRLTDAKRILKAMGKRNKEPINVDKEANGWPSLDGSTKDISTSSSSGVRCKETKQRDDGIDQAYAQVEWNGCF